jgi:hypothetical protein
MNGAIVWFGFATVSTPTIRCCPPLRSMIGAATYITEDWSSAWSARVERAP